MLSVSGLHAHYAGIQALRGVDIEVPHGAIRALIGTNGAGKSTLLNAISGVVTPSAGAVELDGENIAGLRAHVIARRGVLQVPEGRQILGPLSVGENLELGRIAASSRARASQPSVDGVYEIFPILAERRQQIAGTLSGGQQQMLAIGRALMGDPKILLLDEPSLGLSPLMANEVFQALSRLNETGLSILVVEQNARRALGASTYAYVLNQGMVVREGPSSELQVDEVVAAHYLGEA